MLFSIYRYCLQLLLIVLSRDAHCYTTLSSWVCFTDTLIFDNSFSWTRSKTIYYNTEVLCEDEALITTEINSLIEQGDWGTLSRKFETTHL